MRHRILLLILVVAALVLASCAYVGRAPHRPGREQLQPLPPITAPSTPAPPGWRLIWADEFTSGLDRSVWSPYHSTYGDGNAELQCHTPANVTTGGGTLTITARRERITCPNGSVREYSAGFLGTRETGTFLPRYGRFEIRAKLPHAQGMWPAFWLRHRHGSSTAEVDVMEYFHSQVPGSTTGTLHLDGRDNLSKKTVFFEAPTAAPGWHTWAVEIEPADGGVRFTFLLDGSAYHSYVDTQHHWDDSADPDGTWDMAVNLSVGGRWTGHPEGSLGHLDQLGRCAQGGTPPDRCNASGIRRAGPSEAMQVDWVRFFQR